MCRYLHCAGSPAGNPNAVVTAIFQPVKVLMNTRSEIMDAVLDFQAGRLGQIER